MTPKKPLKLNEYYFVVVDKETGELAGVCGENIIYDSLFEIDPQDLDEDEEVRKIRITEVE